MSTPKQAIQTNHKAGICYAATDDGVELPVVDVTQPAFAITASQAELDDLQQQSVRDVESQEKLPGFIRQAMFGIMRSRSVLMRGLMGASGTFMSGMSTYLMKLGPDNLDQSYAGELDRRIAGSPAGVFMRLRLQDMAQLLAAALVAPLAERPTAPLHLLSIGGGPAMDSLNALILIQKERPELLAGRPIVVHSLDQDAAGPSFGARALAALLAEGGPLHGLQASFQHTSYDWSRPEELRQVAEGFQAGPAVVAVSSEGALFEYGLDEHIAGNLQVLREVTPADTAIVGSLTRADALGRKLNGRGMGSRAALQLRGLEAFTALAVTRGWQVAEVRDRPLSHDLRLNKISSKPGSFY